MPSRCDTIVCRQPRKQKSPFVGSLFIWRALRPSLPEQLRW
jgi:hypothetical protein